MTNCTINQIFLGEIASVQNYGAFVKIPGCPQQGLVHKSQVSSAAVDDVTEVLQRGERVWCKIISINEEGKIGLSMKYVNQGSGTDLDPNQVEFERENQKRRTVRTNQRKAIQLQAVYDTTCTKCGTHGHLARDCFMTPDGKKYELLPETDDPVPSVQVEEKMEDVDKKQKIKKPKKSKKSKKMKKKKDTDAGDSDSDERHAKKKKKKHSQEKKKKRKHKKHESTDSSNSSDSDNSCVSSHDIKAHKRKHSADNVGLTKKRKQ